MEASHNHIHTQILKRDSYCKIGIKDHSVDNCYGGDVICNDAFDTDTKPTLDDSNFYK